MVREDYRNKSKMIEPGDAFFFSPKVDTEVPGDVKSVQRFYVVVTQKQRASSFSSSIAILAQLLSWIDCSNSTNSLKGYAKDHISKGEVKNKVALLSLLEQLTVKEHSNIKVVREKLVQ